MNHTERIRIMSTCFCGRVDVFSHALHIYSYYIIKLLFLVDKYKPFCEKNEMFFCKIPIKISLKTQFS